MVADTPRQMWDRLYDLLIEETGTAHVAALESHAHRKHRHADDPAPFGILPDEWREVMRRDLTGQTVQRLGAALIYQGMAMESGQRFEGDGPLRAAELLAAVAETTGDPLRLVSRLRLPPIKRRRCVVCGGTVPVEGIDADASTYAVRKGAWVKIGMATDVRARVAAYSKPRRMRIKMPANLDWAESAETLLIVSTNVEHALHETLEHHHEIGEWFRDHLDVRRALRQAEVTAVA